VFACLQAYVTLQCLHTHPTACPVLTHVCSALEDGEHEAEAGVLDQGAGIAVAPLPVRLLLQRRSLAGQIERKYRRNQPTCWALTAATGLTWWTVAGCFCH
jgi:hypothetical protein